MVAISFTANTGKHNTEKINKCVAVRRAKTDLETGELGFLATWNGFIFQLEIWVNKRLYHSPERINRQCVITKNILNQKQRQEGQFLGIGKPMAPKGRIPHGSSRNNMQSTCQEPIFHPHHMHDVYLRAGHRATYTLYLLPPRHSNVYQFNLSSEWFQAMFVKLTFMLVIKKITFKFQIYSLEQPEGFIRNYLFLPESRKPLANGFLSILRRVICGVEKQSCQILCKHCNLK